GPLAPGDRGGRPHPRLRLLPALGGHRAQPPRLRPRRQDPAPVHGGRDEPHPERAGRPLPADPAGRGAGARGRHRVEQAPPAPPQRAAGQLLPAAPTGAPPVGPHVRLTAATPRRIVSPRTRREPSWRSRPRSGSCATAGTSPDP